MQFCEPKCFFAAGASWADVAKIFSSAKQAQANRHSAMCLTTYLLLITEKDEGEI